MPLDPIIDVAQILAATPPSPPRDVDPVRDRVRLAFKEAFSGRDLAAPPPNVLNELITEGVICLSNHARDLGVAAWLTEALTIRAGFTGLRDGLSLIHGLITRCWDDCLPKIGPDGDTEHRTRALSVLTSERAVLRRIRMISLSDPRNCTIPFCFADLLLRSASGESLATEADLSTGQKGEAIKLSGVPFYRAIAEELRLTQEAVKVLNAAIHEPDAREPLFSADETPDLEPLQVLLAHCRKALNLILTLKGDGGEPRGEEPPPTSAEFPGRTGAVGDYGHALIAFHDRARALADDAERLKKNRDEHKTLVEKLKELDTEFAEISARIAGDPDFSRLLGRPQTVVAPDVTEAPASPDSGSADESA